MGCQSALDMPYPCKCILCGTEIFNEHILDSPKIRVKDVLEKIKVLFFADKEHVLDRNTRRDLKIQCFEDFANILRNLFIPTIYVTFYKKICHVFGR